MRVCTRAVFRITKKGGKPELIHEEYGDVAPEAIAELLLQGQTPTQALAHVLLVGMRQRAHKAGETAKLDWGPMTDEEAKVIAEKIAEMYNSNCEEEDENDVGI